MKLARLICVSAALALLLAVASPVFAGSAKVVVPFAFEVGGTPLPAGEYTFVCPSGDKILQVIDARGQTTLAFVRATGPASNESKARFDKKGDANKLTSVVVYGRSGYRSLSLQ